MDKRVEAIRLDPKVGKGSCSVADETMTDSELLDYLNQMEVYTARAALSVARRYLGCPLCEIGTRRCLHT